MSWGTVASVGYSTLLFLHVLGAFTLVAAVGLFLAILLAVRRQPDTLVARSGCFRPRPCCGRSAAWRRSCSASGWRSTSASYSLTDGWILGRDRAVGDRAAHRRPHLDGLQQPAVTGASRQSQALVMHALLVLAVLLILLDMIYKPGAG